MPILDKEVSGTPMETRGAAGGLGEILQQFFQDPQGGMPFQRQRMEGVTSLFGFDPGQLDIGGALESALRDPADVTAGLFETLRPFEERETERQIGGLREMFGTLGGRFGRNVGQAEATSRAQLAEGFARNRAEQTIPAMLQATGQRNQAVLGLLNALTGGAQVESQAFGQFLDFLQPGASRTQEGLIRPLISASGAAAGAFI